MKADKESIVTRGIPTNITDWLLCQVTGRNHWTLEIPGLTPSIGSRRLRLMWSGWKHWTAAGVFKGFQNFPFISLHSWKDDRFQWVWPQIVDLGTDLLLGYCRKHFCWMPLFCRSIYSKHLMQICIPNVFLSVQFCCSMPFCHDHFRWSSMYRVMQSDMFLLVIYPYRIQQHYNWPFDMSQSGTIFRNGPSWGRQFVTFLVVQLSASANLRFLESWDQWDKSQGRSRVCS